MARDMTRNERAAKARKARYARKGKQIDLKFPDCIGLFPDPGCENVTSKNPEEGDCCRLEEDSEKIVHVSTCPYFKKRVKYK